MRDGPSINDEEPGTRSLANQHCQQLPYSPPGYGIAPVGRDLGQRLQHESPLFETRMRYGEIRRVDDVVSVKNQIEIERPRRARIGAFAAEPLLDAEQHGKQIVRRQRGLSNRRGVEKRRLIADADRCRVIEAGRSNLLDEGMERVERRTQVAVAIAEIAPEGDRDAGNGLLLPACRKHGADTLRAFRSSSDDVFESGGSLLEQPLVFY